MLLVLQQTALAAMLVGASVGSSRPSVVRAPIVVARTFASAEEYSAALMAQADMPAGFSVGNTGFQFSPSEASDGTRATMNLTVIVADQPTTWAAVFTRNSFCGAPIKVGRARLAAGAPLQALVINNKVSNVCSGGDGVADAEAVCAALAKELGLAGGASAVLPASTGVIGWRIPVADMKAALPAAVAAMQRDSLLPAARGIMTTDRYPKLRRASACGGSVVGIAKGAGMIEPNMATMLSFILTDVDVPQAELQRMLSRAADASFNCMSIDSDQSTSDMVIVLSSRKSPMPEGAAALAEFDAALRSVCTELAADVARNGEGTTHVLRVAVKGAPSLAIARGVGKVVVNSPLVKTAMAGNDPNVGRIVGAVGSYLGKVAPGLELSGCTMAIGGDVVFSRGSFKLSPTTEASLSSHIKSAQQESTNYPPHELCVEIAIDLGVGPESCTVLGSDLTAEYVEINADYRS